MAWLIKIDNPSPEAQQRGRNLIMLGLAMMVVALIYVPVALVLQSHPATSIIIEFIAISFFMAAVLFARSGRVNTGAVLLLSILVLAPLAVLAGADSINIIPFALIFSVLVASLILPPWQIWLVLLGDLLGLALVLLVLYVRDLTYSESDTAAVIVASVMLLMVALVSFLGASEIQRERVALRHEIAERRRVQAALLQAKDAAEAANRAKSSFLANMSHELRTPLTAIMGYVDLLILQFEQRDQPELLTDLGTIRRSSDHLLNLISDVLDLSKIEAGKLDVRLETFQIAGMIQDLILATQPFVEQNGNALALDCPSNLGTMHADRTKVRQILLNLLSNAAKFTEQGSIRFSARREPDGGQEWIHFQVADTGMGIDAEQLPMLFQAFTRVHASANRKYDGTGLGLALSRRLCMLMGGTITVTSSLGSGSVFTVRLPAIVPPAPAELL